MNEEGFAGFVLGFLIGCLLFGWCAYSVDLSWKKDVIARGLAAYTVDADGKVELKWEEKK